VSPRNPEIEERIRSAAQNTDKLILKLDTLTNRIDTARANENQELVEYYERKFAEASVEFMDGVETILDDWYELNGEARPNADREVLGPEMLTEIHNTVVAIVQGLPLPEHHAAPVADATALEDISPNALLRAEDQQTPGTGRSGRGNRVDLKG
jgi:hypothetical protein